MSVLAVVTVHLSTRFIILREILLNEQYLYIWGMPCIWPKIDEYCITLTISHHCSLSHRYFVAWFEATQPLNLLLRMTFEFEQLFLSKQELDWTVFSFDDNVLFSLLWQLSSKVLCKHYTASKCIVNWYWCCRCLYRYQYRYSASLCLLTSPPVDQCIHIIWTYIYA